MVDADQAKINAAAESFTRMIWKETTEVAFGIKGRFVLAWYCSVAGNTPAGYAGWDKQVARDCDEDGVNTCYAEMARAEHNRVRAAHAGGRALVAHESASRAIQRAMDAPGFDGRIADRGLYADCGENVYTAASATPKALKEVLETNVATTTWYDG